MRRQPDGPTLTRDEGPLADQTGSARRLQRHLLGHGQSLDINLREQATLGTLASDVVKESEIQSKVLNPQAVGSSVA